MEPYLGEIRIFAGTFAPQGWLYCQGQLVSISEYDALFNLVGTTYGGDGQTTFGLPNLSSRVVAGQGPLPGGSNYTMGQALGTENVALTTNQVALHGHPFTGTVSVLTGGTAQTSPGGNYFGSQGPSNYSAAPGTAGALANGAIVGQSSPAGNSQPHANVQPVLATSYIICMAGIYPSRP
ncbi:MAG: phage tail protein [Janthinobacterium lividum]